MDFTEPVGPNSRDRTCAEPGVGRLAISVVVFGRILSSFLGRTSEPGTSPVPAWLGDPFVEITPRHAQTPRSDFSKATRANPCINPWFVLYILVRHWHRESTLVVAERLEATQAPAEEKLKTLMEMICVRQLTRHDQAIRNWALGESGVSQQIEETESFRLAYVTKLFSACGFGNEDAEFRATIFVSEASREGLLFSRMNEKERLHRAQLFYDLLMAPTGDS